MIKNMKLLIVLNIFLLWYFLSFVFASNSDVCNSTPPAMQQYIESMNNILANIELWKDEWNSQNEILPETWEKIKDVGDIWVWTSKSFLYLTPIKLKWTKKLNITQLNSFNFFFKWVLPKQYPFVRDWEKLNKIKDKIWNKMYDVWVNWKTLDKLSKSEIENIQSELNNIKIYDIDLNTYDLRYGKLISRLNNLNNLTRVYLYAISRDNKFEDYDDFEQKYIWAECRADNITDEDLQNIDSLCSFINFDWNDEVREVFNQLNEWYQSIDDCPSYKWNVSKTTSKFRKFGDYFDWVFDGYISWTAKFWEKRHNRKQITKWVSNNLWNWPIKNVVTKIKKIQADMVKKKNNSEKKVKLEKKNVNDAYNETWYDSIFSDSSSNEIWDSQKNNLAKTIENVNYINYKMNDIIIDMSYVETITINFVELSKKVYENKDVIDQNLEKELVIACESQCWPWTCKAE